MRPDDPLEAFSAAPLDDSPLAAMIAESVPEANQGLRRREVYDRYVARRDERRARIQEAQNG